LLQYRSSVKRRQTFGFGFVGSPCCGVRSRRGLDRGVAFAVRPVRDFVTNPLSFVCELSSRSCSSRSSRGRFQSATSVASGSAAVRLRWKVCGRASRFEASVVLGRERRRWSAGLHRTGGRLFGGRLHRSGGFPLAQSSASASGWSSASVVFCIASVGGFRVVVCIGSRWSGGRRWRWRSRERRWSSSVVCGGRLVGGVRSSGP